MHVAREYNWNREFSLLISDLSVHGQYEQRKQATHEDKD